MGRLTDRLTAMRERREQRLAAKPEQAQRKARAEAQRRDHQRHDHSHTGRR